MNEQEQIDFVNTLVEDIKFHLILDIKRGKIPADWDGIEFRWLLADRFNSDWVMKEAHARKRKYNNDRVVNNI
jgi:hypothetical protein